MNKITMSHIDEDGKKIFDTEEDKYDDYKWMTHAPDYGVNFSNDYIYGFYDAKEHIIRLLALANNEGKTFYEVIQYLSAEKD